MMGEWKCSYGKSCECNSDLEKSGCDLAYKTKMKELTLTEREVLCEQKGATWDLPFKHKIADRWRIPKLRGELTLEQIQCLDQNKEHD